jgi:RNA polymerase sigma-70 factor (ECF subfamily)
VNGVCNNVLRERYRDQKRHQPPAEEPAVLPDTTTPSPEAQLLTKERQQAVREVIERMSPEKSRLLREVLLEEGDREEICRRYSVSPDYLRVLIHRAKKEFRDLYVEREKPLPAAAGDQRAAREEKADRRTVRRAEVDHHTARSTLGP